MPKSKKTLYRVTMPKNMTVKEASEYWDKHSFDEFDDIRETKFEIELKGEKHYVLLDADIAEKIEKLAKKKRKPRRVVINSLLKRSLMSV